MYFMKDSKKFKGCFKEVQRVFQESFKGFSGIFKGLFRGVSKVFQEKWKGV